MADDYKEIIYSINNKADRFISEYRKLKDINKKLIEEKADLQNKLEEQKEQYDSLLSKYENLKSGKIVDLSQNDVKLTKTKINRLVKEIDSCIALLNVN
jgi:predicted RNase H-like nuclease (RuvC/YqgF family)